MSAARYRASLSLSSYLFLSHITNKSHVLLDFWTIFENIHLMNVTSSYCSNQWARTGLGCPSNRVRTSLGVSTFHWTLLQGNFITVSLMSDEGLASATLQPNYSTWSSQINTYPKPYPSVSGYRHSCPINWTLLLSIWLFWGIFKDGYLRTKTWWWSYCWLFTKTTLFIFNVILIMLQNGMFKVNAL